MPGWLLTGRLLARCGIAGATVGSVARNDCWKSPGQLVYAQTMDKLRGIIRLILWAAAAAFAAIRVGTADVFILGAIEGLMVLIAAFVAHKTLDLIFPQKRPPVDQ